MQCNAIAALHIIFLGFLSVALKFNFHLNPSKTIPVNLTTTATARCQRWRCELEAAGSGFGFKADGKRTGEVQAPRL